MKYHSSIILSIRQIYSLHVVSTPYEGIPTDNGRNIEKSNRQGSLVGEYNTSWTLNIRMLKSCRTLQFLRQCAPIGCFFHPVVKLPDACAQRTYLIRLHSLYSPALDGSHAHPCDMLANFIGDRCPATRRDGCASTIGLWDLRTFHA